MPPKNTQDAESQDQQEAAEQAAPQERQSTVPGTGKAVLPVLDEQTAQGVNPLPATARNPALDYNDDAKG